MNENNTGDARTPETLENETLQMVQATETAVAEADPTVAPPAVPVGMNDRFYDENLPAGQVAPEVTEEECGPIHGWLYLFLAVGVGIGSIVSLISAISDFAGGDYYWFSVTNLLVMVGHLVLGAMTILAFRRQDGDAVFLGKAFVVVSVLVNVLPLFFVSGMSGLGADLFSEFAMDSGKSVVWGIIWFSFLCVSEQVMLRIPEETRCIKIRDWVILGVIMILELICCFQIPSLPV